MTMVRTLARNYVLNRLNGNTLAEDRVYNSKITTNKAPFPVICVYTPRESRAEDWSESPYEQIRQFDIVIQIEVMANQTYQNVLDEVCEQIENLIDYRLGGQIPNLKSCVPTDTDIVFSREGEQPAAMASMTYECQYVWASPPQVLEDDLDDLNRMYIQWDMADLTNDGQPGPDGQIDKEDHLES